MRRAPRFISAMKHEGPDVPSLAAALGERHAGATLSHPLVEKAFAETVRRRSERVARTDPAQIVPGA